MLYWSYKYTCMYIYMYISRCSLYSSRCSWACRRRVRSIHRLNYKSLISVGVQVAMATTLLNMVAHLSLAAVTCVSTCDMEESTTVRPVQSGSWSMPTAEHNSIHLRERSLLLVCLHFPNGNTFIRPCTMCAWKVLIYVYCVNNLSDCPSLLSSVPYISWSFMIASPVNMTGGCHVAVSC